MEEELKKMLGKRPDELEGKTLKLFNAIMKIADERDELKEKNKELEEENLQLEAIKDEAIRRYNFESIPVSLVEETMEEYTKLLKSCNRFSDVDRIKAINERMLACKELLEKRK